MHLLPGRPFNHVSYLGVLCGLQHLFVGPEPTQYTGALRKDHPSTSVMGYYLFGAIFTAGFLFRSTRTAVSSF